LFTPGNQAGTSSALSDVFVVDRKVAQAIPRSHDTRKVIAE
jgi:hypothetical protein